MVRWDKTIYSWNHNTAEIEFLMECDGDIVPLEVKADINTKAKSLKVYQERHTPRQTILFCGKEMPSNQNNNIQLPLYLAGKYPFPDQ